MGVIVRELGAYGFEVTVVDGGITKLLELLAPAPSKLGGIPRFRRAL